MAVVTLDPGSEVSRTEPNGRSEPMTEVTRRLSALEENVNRHGRVIKRAIEIATAYFQVERP